MIRAHRRLPVGAAAAGERGAAAAGGPAGEALMSVRLGFDDRHRRRLAVTASCGERVLIDLPEAERLRDGDLLLLEDGRVLAIEAEAEAVADIRAADAVVLTRIAWHLGNRHTPMAVLAGRLRIRRDHVLEAMAEGLGGTVVPAFAPFDPEVGAYHGAEQPAAGGHTHPHRVVAAGDGADASGSHARGADGVATPSSADER